MAALSDLNNLRRDVTNSRPNSSNPIVDADRRLRLVNRVATILIESDEPKGALKEAFDAVCQEIDARYHLFYRVDDENADALVLESASGLDDAVQAERRIRLGQNTSGKVALGQKPLILDNVDQRSEPDTVGLRDRGIRAYAAFPLIAHDVLLGTIAFGSTTRPAFSSAEIALLEMLVHQFSLALDRMRLVAQLRDSETRYRRAVITGRIAAWETDMVARRRIWTQEGMDLFGLSLHNGIGTVGGENDEFWRSLHPADKQMMSEFHRTADAVDDYPCEYRIVRPDGSMIWVSGRGRVIARMVDGKAARVANVVVDVTERKKAEEHVQVLLGEMTHRSKNLLSVVQAIASRTARSTASLQEFETRYAERLRGLAASHDLLLRRHWRGAPLIELAEKQLAPFTDTDSSRLSLHGPDVLLTTEATQAIGLALHELATNATKYGAWSRPNGSVSLAWSLQPLPEGENELRLHWLERGGPTVSPPTRKGFGHFLIETMVARSLRGNVDADFGAEGLSWKLHVPADNTLPGGDAPIAF